MNFRSFLLLLALSCFSLASLAQQTSDADYQARLEKLKGMIEQLKQELESVKGTRNDLQSELQKSETDIGQLLKKIESIKGDLKQQQSQLQGLQQERQQLQLAKRDQQKHIKQQVGAAYRLGQQSNIKLLLNQESPERLSRMLKYYDYFLTARADKINTYLDTISELNTLEPRIEDKALQLDSNRKQLQQRHTLLNDKQAKRQQTLVRLNRAINNKDSELRKLAEDRQRLQQLLDDVAEAVAAIPLPGGSQAFNTLKGQLPWPTQGKVLHRFGSPRVAGKLNWDGVMITAKPGNPVVAVHHGRVVFSDYLRGQGLLLIIDHGQGYMSLYAHNQSLYREAGDWVEGGETIATVGSSGGREHAGLYFEIRHQGRPTNPGIWFKKG